MLRDARGADSTAFLRRGVAGNQAFVVCIAILLFMAVAVHSGQRIFGFYIEKKPVQLRKPLDLLNRDELKPYRFVKAIRLPAEVVEALETRQYIQWVLEDPRRPEGDPLRFVNLFVSYYTGAGFQVAHTPERCYLGGGYSPEDAWTVSFDVPGLGEAGKPLKVPARVVVFSKSALSEIRPTVIYTFYVNCDFACERNMIRVKLANPFLPRTFFSKVEVTFFGGEPGSPEMPEPQQAVKAAEDVFRVVLPILVREHWPRPEDLRK